jgi:hypothetical protein
MPRYHFDVKYDAQDWSADVDGLELRDIDEARDQAFGLTRGLAKDHIVCCGEIAVRVRDDQPQPVVTLRLSMSVEDRA